MQNNRHSHQSYHQNHHYHNNVNSISNSCYQSANLIIENEMKSECYQQSSSAIVQIQAQNQNAAKIEEFSGHLKDENYSQSDEDEIIQFMERTKLRRSDEETSLPSQEDIIKQNYINCIAKSPDLMVSNARESYQKYDSAIKEFKSSIFKYQHRHGEEQQSYQQQQHQFKQQQQQQQQQEHTIQRMKIEGNNVRSNYEHFSTAKQHLFEATVEEEQKSRISKKFQNQQKQQLQQEILSQNEMQQKLFVSAVDDDDVAEQKEQEEEEYKKIPVKDLISTFEAQTKPAETHKIVGKKINQQQQKQQQIQQNVTSDYKNNSVVENNTQQQQQDVILLRNQQLNTLSPPPPIVTTTTIATVQSHSAGLNFDAVQENTNTQDLYTPPQIPLDSYVPPSTEKYFPTTTSSSAYSSSAYRPSTPSNFPRYQDIPPQQQAYKSFPVSQPLSSTYNTYQSQKSSYASTYGGVSGSNSIGKPLSTSWSPQNEPQATKGSTNFNPSPLSYEKLAKFENPDPDDTYQGSSQPPAYRTKPKTIHNVSPTPFISRTPATAQPSANSSFQPVNRQSVYHSGYQPSEDTYSYGVESQPPSSRVSSVDLSQYQNYNTAPRGWTQAHDYYRPVTFATSKQSVSLPYSDF